MSRIFLLFLLLLFGYSSRAQLGFCPGAAGDPIFFENFGAGTGYGPPIAGASTTYTYIAGFPDDGFYTVTNEMDQISTWHDTGDHTGDTNGRALLVNADFTAGEFYSRSISGLCEETPYEFSAWVLNVLDGDGGCGANEIPIQLEFQILDQTGNNILASGTTRQIFGSSTVDWEQFGLVFTTQPGQNSVILKILNVGSGGCGNDLALDDITFRPCGDEQDVTDPSGGGSYTFCGSAAAEDIVLQSATTTNVYQTPEYQWQSSNDGTNFTDIPGETTSTLTVNTATASSFYRVKIAEAAVNLSNDQCVNFSDVFEFTEIMVMDAIAVQDLYTFCANDLREITVQTEAGITFDWYDAASGGNLLEMDSPTFIPDAPGSYFAEARDVATDCISENRTEIVVEIADTPELEDQTIEICAGDSVELIVEATYIDIEWSTEETTDVITVEEPGTYTATITTADGCLVSQDFSVMSIPDPVIESIDIEGDELIVNTSTQGDYEYSLDNIYFQPLNTFNVFNIFEGTVYVRDRDGCGTAAQNFIRYNAPQFFTPNGDGFNDFWKIEGMELFPGSLVEIYDRHGKLLKVYGSRGIGWDGTYGGERLPSADYWYVFITENTRETGHFTLKR